MLDAKAPTMPLSEFAAKEGRYTLLARSKPELAQRLMALAQDDVMERWHLYEQMAGVERHVPDETITQEEGAVEADSTVEEELP